MESLSVVKLIQICISISLSLADVSHFFTPEFGFFQPQLQPQYPFEIQQHPQHPQQALPVPSLYAVPPPPPSQQHPVQGYPDPVTPKPIPTPAPVAPIATTEFFLPEVIENRSLKEHFNFIPLQNQYLPPEERPNYESPKPPPQPPSQGYLPPQKYYTKANDKPFFGYSNGVGVGGGASSGSGANGGNFNGYYYPRPSTTTTTTERPSPIVVIDPAEFVPPINYDPNLPPPSNQGYDYNAPPPPSPPAPTIVVVPSQPSTPAAAYLPPPSASPNELEEAVVVEHSTDAASSSLRLRVQEMRCMLHQGGYFRSVLKVDSFIGAAPSVDNDSYDKRCELKLSRSYVVIDIAEEDFHKCGVHSCGKDLCLRLRFPAIRGMRTGSDAILTLHCKTQDRVAAKTHALKMGVANDVQARSIGTYAHGGTQNPFRTHIELLRKSSNGFTRHLESNGAVQLGEELLLRAHVLAGDGWNYTKLTDVSLQRVSPSGELLNNANLITTRGCINPSMHSICTQPPIFDPPLGHRLAFNAVMFQGMRSGDELVMSMRITGCLEHHDCHVSAQECNQAVGNQGRRKRNISIGRAKNEEAPATINATEISEITRISFRVIMQEDEEHVEKKIPETKLSDSEISIEPRVLRLAGALGFVTLLTCLGIFAVLKLKK